MGCEGMKCFDRAPLPLMGRGWGWGDRHLPHHLALDDDGHFPLDDEDTAVEAARAAVKAVVMAFPGEMVGVTGEGHARATAHWALLGVGFGGGRDRQGNHRSAYGQQVKRFHDDRHISF